jgi:hypothetical protein
MAGQSTLKASKNSATDKKTTTGKTQTRASRIVVGPSKSMTGTEIGHRPMRLGEAKNNQTTGTTTTNNGTKIITTTRDTSDFTMKMVRLETRNNQLFSEPNLQSTNPVSGSAIPQLTKGHQQDVDFSTAVLNAGNPKSAPRAGSPFLKFLHTDIRYLIYDNLVDTEHTAIISPTSKNHSPISALSQSCAEIRNEVKQWSQKRADLTPNPTFGFLNLPLTTFKLSWFDEELFPIHRRARYQRCYSPNAAKISLPHLELWQRAMTISNSCEALYINRQIRYNKKLENFGPKKLTDPLLAYIAHNNRILSSITTNLPPAAPTSSTLKQRTSLSSVQNSLKEA